MGVEVVATSSEAIFQGRDVNLLTTALSPPDDLLGMDCA
jgi:hypothetical protein